QSIAAARFESPAERPQIVRLVRLDDATIVLGGEECEEPSGGRLDDERAATDTGEEKSTARHGLGRHHGAARGIDPAQSCRSGSLVGDVDLAVADRDLDRAPGS